MPQIFEVEVKSIKRRFSTENCVKEVDSFLNAYHDALKNPSEDNLLRMVETLIPFAPHGIEWGIEISSVAGITYMLEGGRVVAVKVSRDEFGPFMQTSITPVELRAIPANALKNIRDLRKFVERVAVHLREWSRRMPSNNYQKQLVEELLRSLEKRLGDD